MNPKKIIFLISFIFLSIFNVRALTPDVEYQNLFYSNRIASDQTYSGKLGYIVANGRVIYCLDPYHLIGSNYQENNNYFNNFNKDDLTFMKLVANYADKYVQQRNIFYYMAAQELIWERIMGDNTVYWTTEINGGGSEHNINDFKTDILSNVNSFLTKPSFDQTTAKGNFFDIIKLEDSNHVLHNYEIAENEGNIAWINGDNLYIKITSSGANNIKLERKSGDGEATYYYNSSSQDLADLYSLVTNTSNLTVEPNDKYHEKIHINFKDKDTSLLVNDEIIFQIKNVQTGEIIYNFTTYNGLYEFDIEEGKYEINTTSVTNDYILNEPIYFDVKEHIDYNYQNIDIYLEHAVGNLIVNSYKDDGFYQIHSYGSYQYTPLLSQMNNFSLVLPLGDYYLIDLSNNKRYDFSFNYKDQYTKNIYYYLNIYPDFKEENSDMDDAKNENDDNTNNKDENGITNNKDIINSVDNNKDENGIINTNNKDIMDKNKKLNELPNTNNYLFIIEVLLFSMFALGIILPHKKNEK